MVTASTEVLGSLAHLLQGSIQLELEKAKVRKIRSDQHTLLFPSAAFIQCLYSFLSNSLTKRSPVQAQAVCEVEGELVKLPPPLQDSRGRCREKTGCKHLAVAPQPCITPVSTSRDFAAQVSSVQQPLPGEWSNDRMSPPGRAQR